MFTDHLVVAETCSETELFIYFYAWPLQVMILNAISLWVTKLSQSYLFFFWIGKINSSLNTTILLTLYVPRVVTNYINKQTRCTFCMYLFYNFCTTLHVSSDHFVHHQAFMIYCILQLCTNRANVSNCSVLRLLDNICLIEQLHVSTLLDLFQAPICILFVKVPTKFVHNL